LQEIILEWINVKGITPKDASMTKEQLSWIFSRNIHMNGIKVPNQYNAGGVISNVITDAWIAELFRRIGNQQLSIVRKDLSELIKKLAA
jgi:hypothetical protein